MKIKKTAHESKESLKSLIFKKSSKKIVPKLMYIRVKPNNNKPDDKAPNIKYFRPASALYSEFLLNVAKT